MQRGIVLYGEIFRIHSVLHEDWPDVRKMLEGAWKGNAMFWMCLLWSAVSIKHCRRVTTLAVVSYTHTGTHRRYKAEPRSFIREKPLTLLCVFDFNMAIRQNSDVWRWMYPSAKMWLTENFLKQTGSLNICWGRKEEKIVNENVYKESFRRYKKGSSWAKKTLSAENFTFMISSSAFQKHRFTRKNLIFLTSVFYHFVSFSLLLLLIMWF